jgi:hypothetical protein
MTGQSNLQDFEENKKKTKAEVTCKKYGKIMIFYFLTIGRFYGRNECYISICGFILIYFIFFYLLRNLKNVLK